MAKLTIKITATGEEFEIEDVDLEQHTPRQLIDEMINQGLLPPETTAPYGVFNKNNVKIDDDELCLSFVQLGFVEGDTIRIIVIASEGRDNLFPPKNKAKIDVKTTWDGAGFELEDVNLEQITNRDLIQQMIDAGVIVPESQFTRAADNTPIGYSLIDKAGVKVEQDEVKTLAELGFTDGDTIRIVMRGSGGGGCSVIYPNYFQSGYTYESTPLGTSLEEKAEQLADEKIAMFRLEQVRNEEDRCRAHIDRIWHGIEEQKQIETYCMIRGDELPSAEIHISASMRLDSIDKMQDLLNNRLAQLQNTTSFFDRLRGSNELEMIKELLMLLESFEIEKKEMLQKIEVLFQSKMHEAEYQLSSSRIRANKERVYFLESCLSDYERELHDLIDRRRCVESELDRKRKEREMDEVYSSIFAPAEVKPKSHMLVRVYLHLFEETEKVKSLAQESDKDAERRDYIPLQCKLKKGDKVDVLLNIYGGEMLLMSDKKSVVWQGSFTKCSFDYLMPKDIDVSELSCVALLTVNEIPVGEMRFITKIVESPRQLNPEIIANKYNKVFISYSHQDESKVKFLHEGLELGGVSHFFDRKYLKTGDVFPQVIQDYINSADLFVLCWSENAAKSEYVEKERKQALERAFPQVKPQQAAKLSIYPMSIEPRAELPSDMKDNYHFGKV